MKFIISIADNGYIASVGHGIGEDKELLNFYDIDFDFLDAYTYDEVIHVAVLDEDKKEEIVKERNTHKKEEEHVKEIDEQTLRLAELFISNGINADDFIDRIDAQVLYTSLMTDTLLPDEEDEEDVVENATTESEEVE